MVELERLDLGTLALFAGYACMDEVGRGLSKRHRGLRFSHGFLFQHLVEGERTIGELSAGMEVTQQAVSKVVTELERLGYVERLEDPADARVRKVRLTARGRAAVEGAREGRAALERMLAKRCGQREIDQVRRTLAEVIRALGGEAAIRTRRVQLPR
jgi:DNA-binding MarR family transcriptional regulator